LLLTPGFFTDAIGFCCLVPAFRRALIKWGLKRVLMAPFGPPGGPHDRGDSARPQGPRTIEGEFRREDD
jgi:UPF0716 protein FxsA